MLKPQQATFVPTSESDGEVATDIRLGAAALTLKWPLADSSKGVRESLERLQVKLQRLQVSVGTDGSEVELQLEVAGHPFAATLRSTGDDELRSVAESLLESVSSESAAHVQSLLSGYAPQPEMKNDTPAVVVGPPQDNSVPFPVHVTQVAGDRPGDVSEEDRHSETEEEQRSLIAGLRALGP